MNFTKELVDKLAQDLLINLSDAENKMVLDEFETIEKNMNLINEIVDIYKIEPMVHPFPIEDILWRDDEIEELTQTEALQNAGYKSDTAVVVPKVVE